MKKTLFCVSLFLAISAFAQSDGSFNNLTVTGTAGIGTTSPQDKLHVFGDGYQRIRLTSSNSTTQFVQYPGASGAYWDNAGIGLSTYFRTSYASIMDTTALTLSPNGNAYFAHDVEAGGQIKAKFQDIAEWVPSTEPIAAGNVVVVGARNHVMPSTDAYDTRVAGVVSPQPGIVLGDAGAAKVLVATSGRVKVRVDTSNGPIQE